MICDQCQSTATVTFHWPTSSGPQHADLCADCAASWWREYQHTDAGQGLRIVEVMP